MSQYDAELNGMATSPNLVLTVDKAAELLKTDFIKKTVIGTIKCATSEYRKFDENAARKS